MANILTFNGENGALVPPFTGTNGDAVSVAAAAAMAGTNQGMQCVMDDVNPDDAYKTGINNTSGIIRARFYFNRNAATFDTGSVTGLFGFTNTAGDLLGVVRLDNSAGVYYLVARLYTAAGGGGGTTIVYFPLTDAPHWIEIYAARATVANNDGILQWWVDGELIQSLSNVANYTVWAQVNYIEMGAGAAGALGAGASGTMYFDQLTVNDSAEEIGPYINSAKGAVLYGSNIPASGESAITWKKWDDGAAGAVTVSGDADWGKLQLVVGAEGRSNVIDLGEAVPRTFTITENAYGSGQGDADLEIRGQAGSFAQDDASPDWTAYTVPTLQTWRYVQIRESRE